MHYRNGKEAKNGDMLVQLGADGKITAVGILHSAVAGNDHCNGYIAPTQTPNVGACIVDCLHIDDVAALIKSAGLAERPK